MRQQDSGKTSRKMLEECWKGASNVWRSPWFHQPQAIENNRQHRNHPPQCRTIRKRHNHSLEKNSVHLSTQSLDELNCSNACSEWSYTSSTVVLSKIASAGLHYQCKQQFKKSGPETVSHRAVASWSLSGPSTYRAKSFWIIACSSRRVFCQNPAANMTSMVLQ